MNEPLTRLPKPDWIRVRVGTGGACRRMRDLVAEHELHTVCSEALCPNIGKCWEKGRATLMILGDQCSRNCRFCGVQGEVHGEFDPEEPERVAEAVGKMGLREVVITSVTRDDLPDGGAAIWAQTIEAIRRQCPDVLLEVLVPDFGGIEEDIQTVLSSRPAVWGHNMETVPSLYAAVRPMADYARSLNVLRLGVEAGLITKTSIMVGLGETAEDVTQVMRDARSVGCRIFYIGQYLQPSQKHLPVSRYVEPQEFEAFKEVGHQLGFDVVVSAPLVRSSFHAEEQAEFLVREQSQD
jgi:lipoic acid synthetase